MFKGKIFGKNKKTSNVNGGRHDITGCQIYKKLSRQKKKEYGTNGTILLCSDKVPS